MEYKFPDGKLLRMIVGDIARITADAIVNAANSSLAGGGGVDGAIHRAGGPSIMEELDKIRDNTGGCPTGSAVVTGAGRLPAKYVFHAVGPVYRDGKHGEPDLLASCYRTCLKLADEHDVRTLSFPSISTGVYRYPIQDASRIALGEVMRRLAQTESKIQEVIFVLFSQPDYQVYADSFRATSTREG
ncbi:MAG TPA: O-acetyl-ADP-ribose deacetylase [Bryobacteraceae bacterium]|nr:O-acetyl-ADP-ribose deacetylase [Bryobacteraceae bacterium]